MPKCFRFKTTYVEDDGNEDYPEFRCYLDSKQCKANTSRGNRRCLNSTVVGLPYCYAHTISKMKVVIKPSTHSGRDGKGVFAHNPFADQGRVFKPLDMLFKFKGQRRTTEQMIRRYGNLDFTDYPYALELSLNYWIDGACVRGVGMMINHAPPSRANVALYPERIRRNDGTVYYNVHVYALKNINHGTELLMDWTLDGRIRRRGQETHRTYDCASRNSWVRGYVGR